jgi:hypothetical protein
MAIRTLLRYVFLVRDRLLDTTPFAAFCLLELAGPERSMLAYPFLFL